MPSLRVMMPMFAGAAILAALACCGWIVWYSWILDFPLYFYDGLLGILVLMLIAKLRWRQGVLLQNVANTVILLIVGLSAADVAWRLRVNQLRDRALTWSPKERIYSFEMAKADPLQFKVWWDRSMKEWTRLTEEITVPDPEKRLPFKLKPGSSGMFFDSPYVINSLGFRDREFSKKKKGTYRIVAIGESTTMGITLKEQGVPWPKLLEQMINERLKLPRRVEVINAGVAAYSIQDNLIRLREDVLPLKPDLIIAYHGYNGFQFFNDAKWERQPRPPARIAGPSMVLCEVIYRFNLRRFKQRHFRNELSEKAFSRLRTQVRHSRNAELHRELLSLARARNITVVLLSYNMAVNKQSPFEVLNFYAAAFPDVRYRIQANLLQTAMLQDLAAENEDLLYVDTSAGLDGHHEHYIDVMHLTQEGRARLTENIFRGIKDHLLDAVHF